MSPKVSIISSVYKENNTFLKLFLDSCLCQSFEDFELIIVDDGATDENITLIKSYNDNRLKILKNEVNLGLTKSLNKAAAAANGMFLARLDTDDFNSPERLLKQVEFLETHPDYVLCGSNCYEILNGESFVQKSVPLIEHDKDLKRSLVFYNPFIHSSLLFRREAFNEVGGYNQKFKYAQDYDLVFQLLKIGKGYNFPEYLINRHVGGHQISVNKEAAQTYYALCTKLKCLFYFGFTFPGLKSVVKTACKFFLLKMLGRRKMDTFIKTLTGKAP